MADNANPQAVKFVNDELRPACGLFISALRTFRQMKSDYVADNIGSLVVPDQTTTAELIADGSDVDGRTRLNGFDVDQAVQKVTALLAFIDGQSGMEEALTKPAVNMRPIF